MGHRHRLLAPGLFLALCAGVYAYVRTGSPVPAGQPAALPTAVAYDQAPALAARVRAGELPPVGERLPRIPLAVPAVASPGAYGGTWRRGLTRSRDHANLLRAIGYENLVRWNPQWTRVAPNLALAVEAGEDYSTYAFTLRLWDAVKATGDSQEQIARMERVLDIAAEQFYGIGICLAGESFGVRSPRLRNVPAVMPMGWTYPTPAPTDPCQYHFAAAEARE